MNLFLYWGKIISNIEILYRKSKGENMTDHTNCNHDHDHDHCDHDEELQIIELEMEDGREFNCIVLGVFDFEDEEYIALLPEDEEIGEDVLIYGFKEIDENEIELVFIEDEDKFYRVAEEFET